MKLEWDKKFESGDEVVDTQHKILFQVLGRIQTAILQNKECEEVPSLLNFFQRYVIEHFECEERLMASCNYPGLATHHATHESIKKIVANMFLPEKLNTPSAINQASVAIAEMFVQHITQDDLLMIRFAQSSASTQS